MITVSSPAKVNLYLNVISRYKNGCHGLCSVFAEIGLCDTMTFGITDAQDEITFESDPQGFFGQSCAIPKDNLITRAVKAYRAACPSFGQNVMIRTEKRIPAGGGLGGGSSNAATVLKVLNRINSSRLSPSQLCRIGAALGADVPFFIRGGVQLAFGTGQILHPLNVRCSLPLLLVFPATRVDTAQAYKAIDDRHICGKTYAESASYRIVRDGLRDGDIRFVAGGLYNKFETVIFLDHSELPKIKSDLLSCGAAAALMSGSGSTMFGLCDDESALHNCADRMRLLGYSVYETYIK